MLSIILLFTKIVYVLGYILYEYIVKTFRLVYKRPPRHKCFQGQTVLITGAGGGLGRLMSIKFAQLGAYVIGWDVNHEGLLKTEQQVNINIEKSFHFISDSFFQFQCFDISDRTLVYEHARSIGKVDILVNNAGILSNNNFILDKKDLEIIKTFDVNALAHFWTVKAFLPRMMDEQNGHIVTISSVAGMIGTPRLSDYSASKFATIGFHEALDLELSAQGYANKIHTTLVCPYVLNTGLFMGATKNSVDLFMPILEPEVAVDRIIIAVYNKQSKVVMPVFGSFVSALKLLMPWESWTKGIELFGIHRVFANITRRNLTLVV